MSFIHIPQQQYLPQAAVNQTTLYKNGFAMPISAQQNPDGRLMMSTSYYDGQELGVHEDMEEYGGEITTRPRLDKKQAARLEAEFDVNPKPNTFHKKSLAVELDLEIARVNNWFQNRRAKAKHDNKRKQLEMEATKDSLAQENRRPSDLSTASDPTSHSELSEVPRDCQSSSAIALEKSRAQNVDGRSAKNNSSGQTIIVMTNASAATTTECAPEKQSISDWASSATSSGNCTPAMSSNTAMSFDRSFSLPYHTSQPIATTPTTLNTTTSVSDNQFGQVYDDQPWIQCSDFDFLEAQNFTDVAAQPLLDIDNQLYLDTSMDFTRRQSDSDDLAVNFGCIEIAPQAQVRIHEDPTTSTILPQFEVQQPLQQPGMQEQQAQSIHQAQSQSQQLQVPGAFSDDNSLSVFKNSECHLDLAARRKRPRPAALGPAALRSRSFGPTSLSPIGVPVGPMHAVRRIKSTGHSLNIASGRIQKTYPGSSQLSPSMIAGSFQGQETFDNLLTTQGTNSSTPELSTPVSASSCQTPSPSVYTFHQSNESSQAPMLDAYSGTVSETAMIMPPSTTPPVTPQGTTILQIRGDYHNAQQFAPLSAPLQYPTKLITTTYTPPYSAGLPADATWPDGTLASTDFCSMSSTSHVPHASSIAFSDMNMSYQEQQPSFGISTEQFSNMASENPQAVMLYYPHMPITQQYYTARSAHHEFPAQQTQKSPRFEIQTFPGQKENHAIAAKALASERKLAGDHKPKDVTFTPIYNEAYFKGLESAQ